MATLQGTFEDASGNVLLNTPHSYAYIESGSTATKAYAKGDLLVFRNQLCQANYAISTGSTLSIGGNVSSTTVANQLSNINVYVGNDQKLHFVDHAGADSVLPFSSGKDKVVVFHFGSTTAYITVPFYPVNDIPRIGDATTTTSNSYNFSIGTSYPSIGFTRTSSSGLYTYTFTIRKTGYYKVAYGGSRPGAEWKYLNVDDTVSMISDTTTADGLISFNKDLTMDYT